MSSPNQPPTDDSSSLSDLPLSAKPRPVHPLDRPAAPNCVLRSLESLALLHLINDTNYPVAPQGEEAGPCQLPTNDPERPLCGLFGALTEIDYASTLKPTISRQPRAIATDGGPCLFASQPSRPAAISPAAIIPEGTGDAFLRFLTQQAQAKPPKRQP